MPKIKSLINFSGTLDQLTFVNSHTYGNHVRRKRGSVKPIVVNGAFKKSSDELRIATPYAKLIKDSVNPYVIHFKDWTLWTRLRSFFRKQVKEGAINYQMLEGFEFHKEHSLYSLLRGRPLIEASLHKQELCISFQLHATPYFPVAYINGYKLTLIVIGINSDNVSSRTMEYQFAVMPLDGKLPSEEQLYFNLVEPAHTFIIALKCEGCKAGEVMGNVKSQGMAVIHVMDVGGAENS